MADANLYPSSVRREVVHALTSSMDFRREALKKRQVIANRRLSGDARKAAHIVIQANMENLNVSQRRKATQEELSEAFIALGRHSLRFAPTH